MASTLGSWNVEGFIVLLVIVGSLWLMVVGAARYRRAVRAHRATCQLCQHERLGRHAMLGHAHTYNRGGPRP